MEEATTKVENKVRQSNKPILRAINVTRRVHTGETSLTIVDDVSLSITEGESVAITGTSGAGKSTLLHLLSGLDVPEKGEIWLKDTPLHASDESELALIRREETGFVFQSFYLLDELTALENVALPLTLQKKVDAFDEARMLLEKIGLSERMDHSPLRLSGGEQQRVAIARAFITRPSILFADEPTGNLDENTGQKVIDLLFDLQVQNGATLVLVTHDRSLADRCSRVIEMQHGRIA